MIRGWRNDPAWVAHYRQRDEERAKREFERAVLQQQIEAMKADIAARRGAILEGIPG